jgi:putative hydrolase
MNGQVADVVQSDDDFLLGRQALPCDCMFALDSDAQTTGQLSYAETALAHARLTAIPVDRIVNCWPLGRLLAWLLDPSSECRC